MKIGLISDTHGDIRGMVRAMELLEGVDRLLHAGDHYRDAYWIENRYPVRVTAVPGNGDPDDAGASHRLLKIQGLSILLCHGHIQRVQRSLTHLYYFGLEKAAQIIIFGHTHTPYLREEDVVMINPGTTSRPRSQHGRTCGILETHPNPRIVLYSLDSGSPILDQELRLK